MRDGNCADGRDGTDGNDGIDEYDYEIATFRRIETEMRMYMIDRDAGINWD